MDVRHSDIDHLSWLQSLGINSFRGLRILDLGCGSGYLCRQAIADGAAAAVGVDIIMPACEDGDPVELSFLTTDLDRADWTADLPVKSFDLVLAFDILEHLESPYRFLRACRDIMDARASLIVTTPNVGSWERYVYPTSWSGVKDPQHKVLFSRYSLNYLLQKSGLVAQSTTAPIRKLSFLGPLSPQMGGQLICHARPDVGK